MATAAEQAHRSDTLNQGEASPFWCLPKNSPLEWWLLQAFSSTQILVDASKLLDSGY